jgi:hypothetical protein
VPFVSTPTWQFLIANNSNSVIADLSGYVLNPIVSPRLSAPSLQTWTVPLTSSVLAFGAFEAGQRRGIAIRNGQVVANDILWRVKPTGGPNSAYATLEFEGPMRRWERRYCRDAGGQMFFGVSTSTGDRGMDLPAGIVVNPEMDFDPAEMLRQALANTIAIRGDLGVSLGGPFSSALLGDMRRMFRLDNLTPLRVSELMVMFCEAGVIDVVITPSAGGSAQGSVSAVARAGTDLPGTSFDYGTGTNNVAWAYPETSMDDFCNHLTYEVGQRIDTNHFANNVTADAPGTTTDPSGSQGTFGVYEDVIMQTGWTGAVPNTSDLFKMYVTRWNAELAARMTPRQVIRIVPQPGVAPEPWSSYNLGDTPRLNLGQLGLDVSGAAFRIIGWDARPQNDGPEQVELLIGWAPE